jgi:hypothetical protein
MLVRNDTLGVAGIGETVAVAKSNLDYALHLAAQDIKDVITIQRPFTLDFPKSLF